MKKRPRKKNTKNELAVMLASGHRCCICFGLKFDPSIKKGQIAHLDDDPSNDTIDNLAFMCLDHHEDYDATSKQARNWTEAEAKHHRKQLYDYLAEMKRQALAKAKENKKAATDSTAEKRRRDVKLLTDLLSTIHIPTLEAFITRMAEGMVTFRIFHFWEGFHGLMQSARTRFHDRKLQQLVAAFHRAWGTTVSFGKYFSPTNHDFAVFHAHSDEEVKAIKSIHRSLVKLKESLDRLVDHVHRNYMEIDLDVTSKAAWKEYKEFHQEFFRV